MRCDPRTVFGSLPLRFDLGKQQGSTFVDVMTIPPSVSRRAYQAVEAGAAPQFFYVRQFRSTTGGPDEFVFVTCRLTGGGARVPSLSRRDAPVERRPGGVVPVGAARCRDRLQRRGHAARRRTGAAR
jgi:hypothetical protein